MENPKKNLIQVNIIYNYYLYIGVDHFEKQKDKIIKDNSIFSLINLSIQSENNNEKNISEELAKNPYLIEDHVPELEIIDKNTIICDKKEYNIKDYIKMINNPSNEFLDDIIKYNYCGKCKNGLNQYFCKICYVNICDKCYEKCKKENHGYDCININEIEKEFNSKNIKMIKDFLNNSIIPMKETDKNSIQNKNNEDILLIIEVISQDFLFFSLRKYRKNLKIYKFCL